MEAETGLGRACSAGLGQFRIEKKTTCYEGKRRLPPQPKPFSVRPDKLFDILGASLALIFRLGTGAVVPGYSASFVSKDEVPSDLYALELADPNTGVAMYESDDIIKYPVGKYGTLTEGFAMIGRMGKGISYTPLKLPVKPLEVWAYEPSPFCKVVREVLVELELPHILHSCACGSSKRHLLYEKAGHFQVPYLEDPNTGVQMFESAEIVEYIKVTYAL